MKRHFTFKALVGIAVLSGALVLSGCKKENSQPATTPNTTTINSPYYITGLLGSEPVTISGPSSPLVDTAKIYVDSAAGQMIIRNGTYMDTVRIYTDSMGHWQFSNWGNQGNTEYITGAQWNSSSGSGGSQFVTGSVQILQKLSVRVYVAPISEPASTYFYEKLLQPGNVAFADNNDPNDGAVLTIRDSQGVLWTTQGHDQTGSLFKINSIGNNMGTYAIITGSVTAKMYDSNGDMKQLSSTAFNAMVGL